MRLDSVNRCYKCVLFHETIAQKSLVTPILWSLYTMHSWKFTVFHLIDGYLLFSFLSFIKSPIPTLQPITAQLHYTALCTDSQSQLEWPFDCGLLSRRVTVPFGDFFISCTLLTVHHYCIFVACSALVVIHLGISWLPITDFLVHDRFPMSLGQKKIGEHLCIIKKFQNSLYHCNFWRK